MRLGYNTNGFASHALEDALAIIAELGYTAVGLTIDHHALNPYGPDFRRDLARVRRRLAELDLLVVVESGARYLLDARRKHRPTVLEDDPAARERRLRFWKDCVSIAAEIGAPVVSMWSGSAPDNSAPEVLVDRLVVALQDLCEHAAAHGVVIGLEPEPGMALQSLAEFDDVFARVSHPALGLTLDVGHAHITEASVTEAIRNHSEHIVNVHLEGMYRGRHDHLLPWEGDLDVRGAMRTLIETGYRGPATFELSRHSHDAVTVAERAFAFARPTLTAE